MTDERLAGVSNTPKVLFLAMVCHCAAELTDGRVPASLMPVLYAQSKARKRDLDVLLAAGLVEKLGNVPGSPMADDYYLPAYLKWNPSKADLEAEREAARDRQRARRAALQAERRLHAV
jgi:hypothetical protein